MHASKVIKGKADENVVACRALYAVMVMVMYLLVLQLPYSVIFQTMLNNKKEAQLNQLHFYRYPALRANMPRNMLL